MRRHRITQIMVSIPTAALMLFGLAASASANPPTRDPLVLPPEFTLTDTLGGNPCGFEVQLHVIGNKAVVTTFIRKDGTSRVNVAGTLKVRLSTDAGQSIDLNISGPTHLTVNADGSISQDALGRALWVFDPGVGPGLPRLALISGRTVSVFDPGFRLLNVSGHVQDICSALSGP